MAINESKILLETRFQDSLGKDVFDVKIIDHISNIVLGECVEVDVRYPGENFRETYERENFPEEFYADLGFRGWDFVKKKIKERL